MCRFSSRGYIHVHHHRFFFLLSAIGNSKKRKKDIHDKHDNVGENRNSRNSIRIQWYHATTSKFHFLNINTFWRINWIVVHLSPETQEYNCMGTKVEHVNDLTQQKSCVQFLFYRELQDAIIVNRFSNASQKPSFKHA